MGLFDKRNEEEARSLYLAAILDVTDPKRKKQMLVKAGEKAKKARSQELIRDILFILLAGEGVERDLREIRKLTASIEPEAKRKQFLEDIDKMERAGLEHVGISGSEIRPFLIKAAEEGCVMAADCGATLYDWSEFGESYCKAALRGYMEYALCQRDFLSPGEKKEHSKEFGVFGGQEYLFWKKFCDVLKKGQHPSYEESLQEWMTAKRLDAEQLDHLRDRKKKLDALLTANTNDERWLSSELLEAFCDWLFDNERFELVYVKGRPILDDWRPATPSAEAEVLFREGRIEEHLGHDYQKIIKLYQQAAEQGHGEAAYRLSLLTKIWETSGIGSRQDWDKKARQAGWLMTDGADADVQFFAAVQMARRGDPDGLHTLRDLLYHRWEDQPKEKWASRPSEDQPWFKEAALASQIELAVNRRLADQGDPEAMYRLSVLYTDIYNSDLHLRDEKLQARYRDECFAAGFGLAYYEAAVKPYRHFVFGRGCDISSETELSEVRRDLARLAEKAGFTGAVQETERLIAKAEEGEEIQRQRSEAFKRKYYAQQRRAAEARYAEARRQAVEAGMDEYRDRRDWAERTASAVMGGSGTTLDESYLRGEVGMDSYGTALFIRGEQEDALRRRLEEEYDAAHHPDEE